MPLLPEKYRREGGPGRPKGSLSGRAQALAVLDEVCADKKVKAAIKKELMKRALENPMAFFMKVIMPLLPKNIEDGLLDDGIKALQIREVTIVRKN